VALMSILRFFFTWIQTKLILDNFVEYNLIYEFYIE